MIAIQSNKPVKPERAVKLDNRWRTVLQSLPVTDNMNEYILQKFVALNARLFFEDRYPYIYGWELPLDPRDTSRGSCDLVLWDGKQAAAVVEIKYLTDNSGKTAQARRCRMRGEVRKQAVQNARIFASLHPELHVNCASITNEDLLFGPYRQFGAHYVKYATIAWKNFCSSYK